MATSSKAFAGGLFAPAMLGLIGLAWAALALWEASPYGRYLDHGNWTQIGLAAEVCRVLPQGDVLLPFIIYTGGWLLMSAAMMLPTALPLLEIFRRMIDGRPDASRLIALVIGGYLSAWAAFGVAAHLLDGVVYALVRESAWLMFNGWAIGAAVLALAGWFQFSALKHHCLTRCRTPLSFAVSHWRGSSPIRDALRLGWAHGVFCVGCCWALMLLMFVVGAGSVGWMLILGAAMALEKNAPDGTWLSRRLGAAIGFVLLGAAAGVTAANLMV